MGVTGLTLLLAKVTPPVSHLDSNEEFKETSDDQNRRKTLATGSGPLQGPLVQRTAAPGLNLLRGDHPAARSARFHSDSASVSLTLESDLRQPGRGCGPIPTPREKP